MRGIRDSARRLLHRYGREIVRLPQAPSKELDAFDLVLYHYSRYEGIRFIQVGAYDGCRADPVHSYVMRHHWRGVLLEPQPRAFEALQRTYASEPQLELVNSALAAEDGVVQLYVSRQSAGEDYEGMCASIDLAHVKRELGAGAQLERIDVPSISVPTLLDKYAFKQFDLLQVDTEGYDAQIIRHFDAASALPPIVRYEHVHLDWPDQEDCTRLLYERGYEVFRGDMDTLAYRRRQ